MSVLERATIVHPHRRGGYVGRVVYGTIQSYQPSSTRQYWRPTAAWAKSAGDRSIRREEAAYLRQRRREMAARSATGYDTPTQKEATA
ncbi:hypothetical protein [Microbacterium sp. zg-YB36]|uniref:hypothetical protein n=1 Tax=Microbacterium sp. zg-YB36 TaxID=2969407 RepID=UPI00214B8816|nr:hypothetical protein [Microbacterium sp. zg-YB36]MDL5351173.1 hypothetical protein [Microbacterium sp. zg-YB36]